jgi:hypothetical protein
LLVRRAESFGLKKATRASREFEIGNRESRATREIRSLERVARDFLRLLLRMPEPTPKGAQAPRVQWCIPVFFLMFFVDRRWPEHGPRGPGPDPQWTGDGARGSLFGRHISKACAKSRGNRLVARKFNRAWRTFYSRVEGRDFQRANNNDFARRGGAAGAASRGNGIARKKRSA